MVEHVLQEDGCLIECQILKVVREGRAVDKSTPPLREEGIKINKWNMIAGQSGRHWHQHQ